MDKLANYRQTIQRVLSEYQQWAIGANELGVQQCVSFDDQRDHYFWFRVGWKDKQRDFGVVAYLRIQQGKIWIEEDWTKQGIANNLLEAGVPVDDIVLGFHHPSKRSLTGFSTGIATEPARSIPTAVLDDRLRA